MRAATGWVITVAALVLCDAARSQTLPPMHTVTVASGLSRPVFVTSPPGDYRRLFIVEQQASVSGATVGRIRILDLKTGALQGPGPSPAPFLTVSGIATGNEQGLLGLAFDPSYSSNGKFYIHYTASGSGDIVVKQYQARTDNPDLADTSAANIKTIISFTHPQTNHNAGWIAFSPRPNDDHNLYISSGDGGNANDADGGVGHHEPGGNAQWDQTLLGKMLRIHIDPATAAVTAPANNPFAGSANQVTQKLWLLGLRNPWRNSFDRATGRLIIADVGQDTREEIDVQEASNPGGGENYGWRDREGFVQNPAYATATPTPTPVPPRVNPILDYPHSGNGSLIGTTVTGGYIYRGKQIPDLRGTYVFGDYSAGKIFTLNYDGNAVSNARTSTASFFPTVDSTPVNLVNPSSFGEDANGELYVCDLGTGKVYKIIPATPNVTITSITFDPTDPLNEQVMIDGVGVPFTKVTIQAAPDMTQGFAFLGTADVGGDGIFNFHDTTNLAKRFYRVTYP